MTDCRCTFAQRTVGDGCDVCNPAQALEYAYGTTADLRAERDALQGRLVTLQRILSGVKEQRDALRAFAQDTLACVDSHESPTTMRAAERHGLMRWDCDVDIYIETPLLTGEQQT